MEEQTEYIDLLHPGMQEFIRVVRDPHSSPEQTYEAYRNSITRSKYNLPTAEQVGISKREMGLRTINMYHTVMAKDAREEMTDTKNMDDTMLKTMPLRTRSETIASLQQSLERSYENHKKTQDMLEKNQLLLEKTQAKLEKTQNTLAETMTLTEKLTDKVQESHQLTVEAVTELENTKTLLRTALEELESTILFAKGAMTRANRYMDMYDDLLKKQAEE